MYFKLNQVDQVCNKQTYIFLPIDPLSILQKYLAAFKWY